MECLFGAAASLNLNMALSDVRQSRSSPGCQPGRRYRKRRVGRVCCTNGASKASNLSGAPGTSGGNTSRRLVGSCAEIMDNNGCTVQRQPSSINEVCHSICTVQEAIYGRQENEHIAKRRSSRRCNSPPHNSVYMRLTLCAPDYNRILQALRNPKHWKFEGVCNIHVESIVEYPYMT